MLTIYKSFRRPHFNYGDIIYHQAYNVSFHQKLESVQYSALTITSAIRKTSTEKVYNELSLETREKRRWYRKLCFFDKVYKDHSSKYLFLEKMKLIAFFSLKYSKAKFPLLFYSEKWRNTAEIQGKSNDSLLFT